MVREKIAAWLFAKEIASLQKRQADIDLEINQRVADVLLHMDPFEPLLRKYHVIFSEDFDRPEDNLSDASQLQLCMWAYGQRNDPNFKFLTDFIINTQGNATVRKAKNDHEWLYGRAALATITLFRQEIGRLALHYEEILAKQGRQEFDSHLAAE